MGIHERTSEIRQKTMGDKNPSKREENKKKIRTGLQNFYINGGKVWNLGLTKKDPRVQKYAINGGKARLGLPSPQKGVLRSKEVRALMSKNHVNTYFKKGYGYKGKFWSEKNDKEIGYRSTWELHAMQIFEQLDDIVKYEYETLSIPYLDENGYIHATVPDFLVYYRNGSKKIIEIKPEFMIKKNIWNTNKKISIAKEFAEEHHMEYKIWTEKQLNNE
jgi:hypothetical protein